MKYLPKEALKESEGQLDYFWVNDIEDMGKDDDERDRAFSIDAHSAKEGEQYYVSIPKNPDRGVYKPVPTLPNPPEERFSSCFLLCTLIKVDKTELYKGSVWGSSWQYSFKFKAYDGQEFAYEPYNHMYGSSSFMGLSLKDYLKKNDLKRNKALYASRAGAGLVLRDKLPNHLLTVLNRATPTAVKKVQSESGETWINEIDGFLCGEQNQCYGVEIESTPEGKGNLKWGSCWQVRYLLMDDDTVRKHYGAWDVPSGPDFVSKEPVISLEECIEEINKLVEVFEDYDTNDLSKPIHQIVGGKK